VPPSFEGKARRAPPLRCEPSLGSDVHHFDQSAERRPRRDMRSPLPSPDVGRVRLRAPGRLGDLGELHGGEPRQDVPPEQIRVVGRPGVGLVPLRERPFASRDGSTAPATDLGRLRGVGGYAGVAADVARVRDCPATVGTGPQCKSGRPSCWALEDPAGSRTTGASTLRAFTTACASRRRRGVSGVVERGTVATGHPCRVRAGRG